MIKTVNQNDYPDVIYITNTDGKYDEDGTKTTIKDSGCGICAAMMVMDFYYPDIPFSLEDAIELSYSCCANHGLGTDYRRYCEKLCDTFDLTVTRGESEEELIGHLKSGNIAVINVGGNHDDYLGVFSNQGHYILAEKMEGEEVRIIDPSFTDEKYLLPHRREKVGVENKLVYALAKTIIEDTRNRKYPLYLFKRKPV